MPMTIAGQGKLGLLYWFKAIHKVKHQQSGFFIITAWSTARMHLDNVS